MSADAYTFPKEIYEGFHMPSQARPLKKSVKEVIVKPHFKPEEMEAREGTYFTEKDVDKIYDEDVDVYVEDPTQPNGRRLLAKLRRQVLDPETVKRGWEAFWMASGPSRNRGAAAGPIDVKGKYWKKRNPVDIKGWAARDGKDSKMRVNNNVFSSVLGYFEATPFMKLPCRLTTYTMRYWKQYKHGQPYIQAIDKCFRALVPDRHRLQLAAAKSKPLLHIPGTAFSSVTINRNFRTALHRDAGDFREGYGNLSVIERGSYHGGYTLFPQYKIGFDLRTGDFIAMDVHEWHCNTALYETAEDKKANATLPRIHKDDLETGTQGAERPFTRVSFVCYLREKLRQCKGDQTRRYFKEIGFNPATQSLTPPKRQTRRLAKRQLAGSQKRTVAEEE